MSDLDRYISKRKKSDQEFKNGFNEGYLEFKIGVAIRKLRKESGLTQEELANKLHTKKSYISKVENHAEDIRLSTLMRIAHVLGKQVDITFLNTTRR
ncbi:MAG: helix-turn-helix transcriptional regulator [Flavobacteriales bacterium]|nr:helix-turn-helix transcriptional regulator [Flavobacteriales bacterium]